MPKSIHLPRFMARTGTAGLLCLIGSAALAQAIQIQIPKMTERAVAGGTQTPGGATPSTGAYPGAQGAAQQGSYSGQQQAPAYGAQAAQPAQQQAYGSAAQPQPYGSGVQSAYGGSTSAPAYGAQHSSGTISGPAPTRPTTGGPCKVSVSPERQTLILVGATDNLPRTNLPLGDFRAQTVIHAPDGRWAVAFLKLRGQPQFAMFTMDLTNCKEGHTVDLAQAGEDAAFEGDNVMVRAGGKTQQWPLANPRMR